jgi:vancomycin permeability regulator SanA
MISRFLRRILFGTILVAAFGCTLMIAQVQFEKASAIKGRIQDLRPVSHAIVLGASVKQDGTPSDALRDRILTASELYKDGKVTKLLMTGDDGKFHVDEVSAMKKTAEEFGVPSVDILVDGHGYRTYESCKRARAIYDIQQAIVVTQRFHLGRALFLCSRLGIDIQGMIADRQSYQKILIFTARDIASSVKAWWDIHVQPPKPPVQY